jgi:hypothetical protein
MNNIWLESPNPSDQAKHHLDLFEWFSKSWPVEYPKPDGIAQQMPVWVSFDPGQETFHTCAAALGDAAREPNAVLAKVKGDESNFHFLLE